MIALFDEGVDVDAATKCGIKVARIPGDVTGNAASCAEMAIYLMLGLLRKQVRFFFQNLILLCCFIIYDFANMDICVHIYIYIYIYFFFFPAVECN